MLRRLFVLVLLTAFFVAHLDHTWPEPAVSWLRLLGGKSGLKTDLDGLYVLLAVLAPSLLLWLPSPLLPVILSLGLLSHLGNHQFRCLDNGDDCTPLRFGILRRHI